MNTVPHIAGKHPKDAESLRYFQKLMSQLGDPQDIHKSVHVTATSGKGTICYLVDAILRAHGKRCGLTVSPHVYDIRERIQINGQMISEKLFTDEFAKILQTMNETNQQPGYFSTLMAMAFAVLGKAQIEYSVIECGVGGMFDNSNIIKNPDKLCVIGQIGFDHSELLGDTLEKIAAQKAGIIQTGQTVIALQQTEEINKIFKSVAQQKSARLIWVESNEDYQKTNDSMALTVAQELARRDSWQLDHQIAQAVLENVFIPGRFEKRQINDLPLVLDGAHNPQKLNAVCQRLSDSGLTPVSAIVSFGEKKNVYECLKSLKPYVEKIYCTDYAFRNKLHYKKPLDPNSVAMMANELNIYAVATPNPLGALRKSINAKRPILATGSFYLLSEIDKLMQSASF